MTHFDSDPNEWAGDPCLPDPEDLCPGCRSVVTYGAECDECANATRAALWAETFDAHVAAFEEIAATVELIDNPEDVIRLRNAYFDAVQKMKIVEAETTKRFLDQCRLLSGVIVVLSGGRVRPRTEFVVGGKRYYPTVTKESERWDGAALVSRVASVLADQAVDDETGEILPPSVFAEKVATATAKVLGGFAPSTKWRTSFLNEIGVKDATKYRSYEAGTPKIGEAA